MAPVVEVETGKLRGSEADGVYSFLGIPYGGDTAGVNRFRPPVPPKPWAGIRPADDFGLAAPQPDGAARGDTRWGEWLWLIHPESGSPLGRASGEDCLVLNVWTPSIDGDVRRPVLVWLHGGGFGVGAGHDEQVRGDNLASQRDVVVVTVNHRLGALGYLDLEEILGPDYADSGVAGMLDIVAALEWVRNNIAGFGGDPSNVTVAGHSGGGGKVSALLSMPSAGGLFHRAVVQSGPLCLLPTRGVATKMTHALLDALGLDRTTAGELRKVDIDRLLAAQSEVRDVGYRLSFSPVAGVDALPAQPIDSLGATGSADVPLMIGTTLDDAGIALLANPELGAMSVESVRTQLRVTFGDEADGIFRRYQVYWPDLSPERLLIRIKTEHEFRASAVQLAERRCRDGRAPVFVYVFTHNTSALNGLLGSGHNLELPFVFGNVNRIPFAGDAPDRHQVEDNMGALWSSFARDGVPSHPALGACPPYDPVRRHTLLIDADLIVEKDPWGDGLRAVRDHPSALFRAHPAALSATTPTDRGDCARGC